ncbi:DUF4062 domain-containing protein [Chitinophagaceae bacterium 26-R-25]|nr:DUF4062 domain-containing protein [Chitinophagaceae bacterium 26-R-25]
MGDNVKRIRIFLASPGDVAEERDQLPKVVQEINLIISAIAPEKKIILDLIRWETNTFPALGDGAQPVINTQLPDYDIFIGMMWKRFGTPTKVAGSGTEEEFSHAFEKWEQNNAFPVLFYFCQNATSLPGSLEEIDQLRKVIEFKMRLLNKGLIWEYKDQKTFADVIRPHLVMTIGKMLSTTDKTATAAIKQAQTITTESDMTLVRTQLNQLTIDYTNVRAGLRYGNERTRQMTLIESKMRAMAFSTSPFLPELVNSATAGNRLAAIAILKEIPDDNYLAWLSSRVGKAEANFVGYHASLALLSAARNANDKNRSKVKEAITNAIANVNKSEYKDPNQEAVLKEALQEIEKIKVTK